MAVRFIEAIANIEQHERTDSGALKVRALARTPGILTYYDSSGARNELVSTEFLRKQDGKGSFLAAQLGDLPVTLEHPPTLLRNDSALAKKHQVGKTEPKVEIYKDGAIEVVLHVDGADAIEAIESGEKTGVSLGYLCNVTRKDGMYSGVRYDAEQCEPFHADHLAIVANPRAKEALIKSFERTDDGDDIAVALYEDFEPVLAGSDVVDPPRSDSMGTNTAATVAISDVAQVAPEKFQIDINGSPFHVDSALYEAINAERADMGGKGLPPEFMKNKKKKGGEDEDEDDEKEDMKDYGKKDAAGQIGQLLGRCDAATLPDALYNLNVLVGRFDDADTVADVVDLVDTLQGKVDALESHADSDDATDKRYDSDDVEKLLNRLDCDSPEAAVIKLDGIEFVKDHGHMLPKDFHSDGLTLPELQKAAIAHCSPKLALKNDSDVAVDAAFQVVASNHPAPADGVPARVDSSQQLDDALAPRQDMISAGLPSGAQRVTGTPMTQKPSPKVWNLSY